MFSGLDYYIEITLEKTEVAIKNGLSSDTGNIGYPRHRTKTNKTKSTTQHRKL